jgi:hypothetical protein
MTEPKSLIADAAIGSTVEQSFILASHPDERKMPDGTPSPTRRTFVLRLTGGEASIVTTVPAPLARAWTSSSGQAYCAPLRGNYVFCYSGDSWKREEFSATEEQITFVSGISRGSAEDDIVYLSTFDGLFVRDAGKWTHHSPPRPAKRLYGTCGVAPDQVYVCADRGLLLWNGEAFEEIEGPKGDLPESIWADSKVIFAGGDYLNRWTEADGWRRVTTEVRSVTALQQFSDQLYVGTYKRGVVKLSDGAVERVTEDFFCLSLHGLADGLFAIGEKACYLCTKGECRKLSLPTAP